MRYRDGRSANQQNLQLCPPQLSCSSMNCAHNYKVTLTWPPSATRQLRADGWTIVDHLLLKEGKVFVPSSYPAVSSLLEFAHGMGHEGIQKTLHRLRSDFYIPGDRRLVLDFVRNCEVCQRNKTEHLRPGGLLQPLDIPSAVWADVAMV